MTDPARSRDTCLLCGGRRSHPEQTEVRDFEYCAPGIYAWLRCVDCGLVRIEPEPEPEVLAVAYPPSYHAYQLPRSQTTQWLRSVALTATARSAVDGVPSGSNILDVGCAAGDLLVEIGRSGGHSLFGVEYDRQMADRARSRGITVFEGSVEEADLPDAGFDLVIMQHVLEHVIDPVTTLQALRRAMKQGARLTGELPNLHCWDACLFGRYWGGGHAPRHITHFMPDTLRRMLEQCGFRDVKLSPSLHTGHAALSLQNWFRRNRHDTHGLVSGRAAYYPLLLLAMLPLNLLAWPFMLTGVMRFEAHAG